MKKATLVFLKRDGGIYLAAKKKSIHVDGNKLIDTEGILNGYGGKVQDGESVEEAAIRELFEESCVSGKIG